MLASDSAEPDLWHRYHKHQDQHARDQLFLQYVPWATSVARSLHHRMRAYRVDRDDFVQNATIGLLEAMSRFDPNRGIAFRSYAQPRVRGAVFNGLRTILGDRSSASDEARFAERLQSLQAVDSEPSAFEAILDSIVGLGIAYLLDETAHQGEGDHLDGLAYVQSSEIEARLSIAVSGLPDRLKLIIQSHYFQFVPFQELATRLGVTKGRISQLHKNALDRLRDTLRTS